MSIIARDPTFSWSSPLTSDDVSEKTSHSSGSHTSHSKQMERRMINMWKSLTRSTRKQKRASVYAKDFVIVTAATSRRRSIMASQDASQIQQSQRPSHSALAQYSTL